MPLENLAIPHVEDARIVVDGRALEPAWGDAVSTPPFVAFEPVPDRPPTGQTLGRLLADDKGLHVFVHAFDPEPDKIRASAGPRDTRFEDDWVGLWFDPSGEGQREYIFIVTAAGMQIDGVNPSGAPEDYSWDGRWSSAVVRTADGYDVEMSIPWRSIRHPRDADHCGMFLGRSIPRVNEQSLWPRLDTAIPGFIVQQAIVGGPGELPRSGSLNLIPEVTVGAGLAGGASSEFVTPGITAEWSPGAVQVLATVNGDYSQVESDAAQIAINRRYALYYDDYRPFFTEGREWFLFPFAEELVYSRAMVSPVYGTRATGEWGPWTVAALQVLDEDPQPTITLDDTGAVEQSTRTGWTTEDLEDRVAFESVLRVKRAMGGDKSLGFIATDKIVAGTSLANRLAGVDGRARFGERWTLAGSVVGSTMTTATDTLDGAGAYAEGGFGSKHVSGNAWAEFVGPDLRAEDGFLSSADKTGGGGTLGFDIYPPIPVIPKIWIAPFDGTALWTTAGDPRFTELSPNIDLLTSNGFELWVELDRTTELFAGEDLRYDHAAATLEGPVGRWLDLEIEGETGERPFYDPETPTVGWVDALGGVLGFRPVPAIRFVLEPTWEQFFLDDVQLYDGFVARARLETYTSRHLWQRLIVDRDTFSHVTSSELLLAWEGSPGNAFYLGGSMASSDAVAGFGRVTDATTWQVFAKGSWVFSL